MGGNAPTTDATGTANAFGRLSTRSYEDPVAPEPEPVYSPTTFLVDLDPIDTAFVLGAIQERGCSIESFMREALINHAHA